MVAEETNTAPLGRVSPTPLAPNRMVSVWAALTTTLTTTSAFAAASAGVWAPLPPSATNRATLSAETSQPVTSNPARRSEVAMPKPIDPRPITAISGFLDSAMPRSLNVLFCRAPGAGPLGITARPLAVRARADAGLIRKYQRETRRRRLAGNADQRRARLSRSGKTIAARRGRPADLRRRAYQGSAAAYRVLPDPQRRPRRGSPAFDAFGGAVDAARDRSARRAAADDAVLSDEVRHNRAAAVLSARRPRCRRCDQGTGRKIFVGAARQPRTGGVGRHAGGRRVRDGRAGRDRKTLSAAARAEPAISVAGTGDRFVENVRVDAAGAWAGLAALEHALLRHFAPRNDG